MISIIIPIYNEEKNIVQTIEEIREVMDKSKEKYEIITINDGSTDKSSFILSKIKGIKTIHHIKNKGYGASIKTGIRNSKGTHILIIDCDRTYSPYEIPKLLKYKDYDMVVGSRTGKHVKVSFERGMAKKLLILTAKFLTGKKIPDLNSGLRLFKRELADEFFNFFPDGFSFTTTITIATLTNSKEVLYIPINYYQRKGKSKIRPMHFFTFLHLILRIVTYFKPLKTYTLVSLLLFSLAFLIFLYSFFVIGRVTDITIIVIVLSSLQIFLFGILSDLIVRSKK